MLMRYMIDDECSVQGGSKMAQFFVRFNFIKY